METVVVTPITHNTNNATKTSQLSNSDILNGRGVNMLGMNQNYAHANEWFAHFALEDVLGEEYKDLDLHLTRFSLPQMEQKTSSVPFRGYTKQIPLGVINPDTKELTLEYLVDSNWKNYKALYAWMSSGLGVINPVLETTTTITPDKYIPLRIYLLDNFKHKVIQFKFSNCFIIRFNDIALDAQNSAEVTASVTFCYDDFQIEDVSS